LNIRKQQFLHLLVACDFKLNTFLHLQTSADNIVEFVTNIKRDMDVEEDAYLETSKILVVSHDISLNNLTQCHNI